MSCLSRLRCSPKTESVSFQLRPSGCTYAPNVLNDPDDLTYISGFNEINQINETNEMNEIDQTNQMDQTRVSPFTLSFKLNCN